MDKTEKNKNLMRKNILRKIKKQAKGITLIALVVTIIVLLILAGVAINLTIGDSGILNKSKMATEKWEEASKNEQDELDKAEEVIDDYLNNNGQGTDGEKATAMPPDVLKGKTYYTENGELQTGTLEILDTSDANATSEDILEGKTAYVNGEKITGTLSTTEGNMTGVTRETVSLKTEGTYTFSADHKAVFIRAHYTGYDGSSLSTTTINGDFTIQGQENHWVNASFGTWGYAHVLIYGINPKSGNQIKFKLNGTTNSNLTLDIFFYD